MTLLRKMLLGQAVLWSSAGIAVALLPHWVLVTLFRQVPYPDYTYVRACGVMSMGFSLLAVLVAQKLDDVWWWAWTFAITDAALATITGLNALVGARDSGIVLWWLFSALNALLAVGLLVGIGRAGEEKPFA
ncbi:MAG: hypothetical protein M3P11_08000 [Actinomycetota bacterium]|nr:hypothetical protein [Actinomycetota bacterium]